MTPRIGVRQCTVWWCVCVLICVEVESVVPRHPTLNSGRPGEGAYREPIGRYICCQLSLTPK